jgi:hypothetical protein
VTEKSARTKILSVLGGIGVATHLLLLRWSMFPLAADPSGTLVNNFFVTGTLLLVGGLSYALLLRYPVTESIRARKTSPFVLFKGGVLGAVATSLAFQGRYLVAACFLTYKTMVGVPEGSLKSAFLLALLSIETYALIELFYFLIPAFACGVLVTAVVARSFSQPSNPRASNSASPSAKSPSAMA